MGLFKEDTSLDSSSLAHTPPRKTASSPITGDLTRSSAHLLDVRTNIQDYVYLQASQKPVNSAEAKILHA